MAKAQREPAGPRHETLFSQPQHPYTQQLLQAAFAG